MMIVPSTIGIVTSSPRNTMARPVEINGWRLSTAEATEAPTLSMARNRSKRPPTVPISPASTNSSTLFVERWMAPPVTRTAAQSAAVPTMRLIQNPL